jgi:hypothetical protein
MSVLERAYSEVVRDAGDLCSALPTTSRNSKQDQIMGRDAGAEELLAGPALQQSGL